MQKLSLFIVFLLTFCLVLASPRPIQIRNKGAVPSHYELPAPADQPDVYYDDDTQEVIIDGLGYVDYYDVEIAAAPSWTVVLTTQISGSYDTIDVSSLPQGDYLISIESPLGNTFVGYFDTW